MEKIKLSVDMHCVSCEINIKKVLEKLGCAVSANAGLGIVKVSFDAAKVNKDLIVQKINELGYDAKEIN